MKLMFSNAITASKSSRCASRISHVSGSSTSWARAKSGTVVLKRFALNYIVIIHNMIMILIVAFVAYNSHLVGHSF